MLLGQTGRALRLSALFVWAIISFAAAAESVRVAQVLDGDSLRLTDGRELRLIGINTPEFGKNGASDEPFAREARAALARLVASGEIQIEYDAEPRDHYGRTLAHAFLPDSRSVQEILLRDGLAFLIAEAPNLARLEPYVKAEADARRAGRGVWSHSYYQPRAAARLGPDDTGFRFVEGEVQRVGRGPHATYLDLTERLTLVIPHGYWHFFGGDPKRFLHRHVVARGWITAHENRLRLRLSHPAMLEW